MLIAIVIFLLLGYLLIASEHITHINKAAIAIFCGVVAWILFMCTGTSFIENMHHEEFMNFLDGEPYSVTLAKEFIASHIFIHYAANICSVVVYLLVMMAIIEVLMSNGCFDFITNWCRGRSKYQVVWMLVFFTFLISANLDNLTTTVMMLPLMRRLLHNTKQRMWVGATIVIAANCGGCFTVIGDVSSLMIWTREAVTPSNYTGALILPALAATIIPVALIVRQLPERLDLERPSYIFRGDDTVLRPWQRILMLIVGLCGLWFIPTFHRITHLPPFLGAACVLGLLWVVNEVVNRRLIRTEQPISTSQTRALQYECLQVIMFFIGISLSVGVLIESGAMQSAARWLNEYVHNIYLMSLVLGFFSAFLDNIALVLSAISIFDVLPREAATTPYLESFMMNGQYWHLIALSGCVGGCLLPIGNTAGYALMKSEGVTLWWYLRRITLKVLLGWFAALGVYFIVDYFLR